MPSELIGPIFLFLGVIATVVVGRSGQRGQALQARVESMEEQQDKDRREQRILLNYVYELRGDLQRAVDADGVLIPVRDWPDELTQR